MLTWKVEAEGDTVYVEAETLDQAEKLFEHAFGVIPKKLVKWTKIDSLPNGEEAIAG
jgi:hypothetical protein